MNSGPTPTGGNAPLPDDDFSQRACAWPRRQKEQGPVRMIAASEVPGWIVYEDDRLLVVNKPGDVVCHPSKAGPWSSLVGALREYTGLPTVHLVFRLDRETSGVVVLAKDPKMASRLQVAMMERKVGKAYQAILSGRLPAPVTVNQPLGDDVRSPVFVKSAVVGAGEGGQSAITHFTPEAWSGEGEPVSGTVPDGTIPGGTGVPPVGSSGRGLPPISPSEKLSTPEHGRDAHATPNHGRDTRATSDAASTKGFTLARIVTETGRKHQIRAHAQWLGYPLVGDKIYGPDARCYLEFIDHGWTEALAAKLLHPRQALHCAEIDLRPAGLDHVFRAPLAGDLQEFWKRVRA